MFVQNEIFQGNHFLGIEGWWGKDKIPVTFINVYAPCELFQKKELWRELIQMIARKGGVKWCIIGDFNTIKMRVREKGWLGMVGRMR